MASLLLRRVFTLSELTGEDSFPCLSVTPVFEYDENGKRTDTIKGHAYIIGIAEFFQQCRVVVEGNKKPIFTNEQLQAERENGQVYVEFENAILKPYVNSMTKSLEDSIKADSVSKVTR